MQLIAISVKLTTHELCITQINLKFLYLMHDILFGSGINIE